MNRNPQVYRVELREKMRGGSGTVKIEHLWEPGTELKSNTRMTARLTLAEGCSIGFHRHEQEEELFFIIRGTAEADDNGTKVILNPGDTMLTGNGAGHAIANAGKGDLEILAVIAKY